jgi:MFS family permease
MAAPVFSASPKRLGRDFWTFFTGQTLSNLGTSFTNFALPLIVYKLTGSALNLAITSAAVFLPYLLFGLLIGAWVDRVNRKRLMIIVDTLNTISVASIPVLSLLGLLHVWYIYAIAFVGSTLAIFFQSAEFAAIPGLVGRDDLVKANGRIQASFSAMGFIGPLLAALLVFFVPVEMLLFIDAASYLVSVFTLALVRVSFNIPSDDAPQEKKSILHDVIAGLRYVLSHPVLRMISLMMALVNFFGSTIGFELVYFAKRQLLLANWQYGILLAAGPIGVVVLSLLAGPLHARFKFSRVALGALATEGFLTVILGLTTFFWAAVPLMALTQGLGILFNINTGSLRQAIVPNHLLGRVVSIAGVLAWSAIPVGTILGGLAIDRTQGVTLALGPLGTVQNIGLVYSAIGIVTFVIPLIFAFTPLGHAEHYIPTETPGARAPPASAAALPVPPLGTVATAEEGQPLPPLGAETPVAE